MKPYPHESRRCDRTHSPVQLEQDTGQTIASVNVSLVDLNRVGAGVIEIITAPFDVPWVEFASAVMKKLPATRRAGEASVVGMKWGGGGLLAGVRVSLHPKGVQVLGQGCGIKNLSSLELVGEYYSNLLISPSIPPNTTSLKPFSTASSTLSVLTLPSSSFMTFPSKRFARPFLLFSLPSRRPPKSAPASPPQLWSPGRLRLGLEYSLIGQRWCSLTVIRRGYDGTFRPRRKINDLHLQSLGAPPGPIPPCIP